jgi:LL-diaminopimelate aminotransferase
MHSLSKTFNMTGWRVGFAVGHADLVAALAKVKTNIDSGVFMAVQSAGMVALRDGAEFMKTQRQVFQERRDQLAAILKESGFRFQVPAATFYLWVEVPKGMTAMQFCQRSIQETGVVITPGTGMGAHGEGFFRVTITAPKERLIEAGKRLQKLL